MFALVGLLAVITILLISSRVASVALEATGMARESAQFQARSALMGVGFTTSEAEDITSHPVRRRIVLYLMTVGNASVVTGIGSFLLTFLDAEKTQTLRRSGLLVVGLVVILGAFHTRLANRGVERATRALLNKYTSLDTRDYAALLRIENQYAITELHARTGDWIVGRPLSELHLTKEGVVVLGVHRSDNSFVGAPMGETVIEHDDAVVAYGRIEVLQELASRPASRGGDVAHDRAMSEQQHVIEGD